MAHFPRKCVVALLMLHLATRAGLDWTGLVELHYMRGVVYVMYHYMRGIFERLVGGHFFMILSIFVVVNVLPIQDFSSPAKVGSSCGGGVKSSDWGISCGISIYTRLYWLKD